MSTVQELQADLDTIKSGVAEVLVKVQAQADQIAALTAGQAAGSPVTQQQLDDLDAEAKAIVASLTPLAPPQA